MSRTRACLRSRSSRQWTTVRMRMFAATKIYVTQSTAP